MNQPPSLRQYHHLKLQASPYRHCEAGAHTGCGNPQLPSKPPSLDLRSCRSGQSLVPRNTPVLRPKVGNPMGAEPPWSSGKDSASLFAGMSGVSLIGQHLMDSGETSFSNRSKRFDLSRRSRGNLAGIRPKAGYRPLPRATTRFPLACLCLLSPRRESRPPEATDQSSFLQRRTANSQKENGNVTTGIVPLVTDSSPWFPGEAHWDLESYQSFPKFM